MTGTVIMTEKKVKLTESSMRGYSGHLFMTEFKNGETVTPISQRKLDRILATVRAELVDKPTAKEPETKPPVKQSKVLKDENTDRADEQLAD